MSLDDPCDFFEDLLLCDVDFKVKAEKISSFLIYFYNGYDDDIEDFSITSAFKTYSIHEFLGGLNLVDMYDWYAYDYELRGSQLFVRIYVND